MENNVLSFTPLADEAFLSLGAEQIAYVKAINLPDGAHAVGIFSADGKPMASRRSRRRSSASTSWSPRWSTEEKSAESGSGRALGLDRLDEQRIQRLGILGRAQFLDEAAITQQT